MARGVLGEESALGKELQEKIVEVGEVVGNARRVLVERERGGKRRRGMMLLEEMERVDS